MCSGTAIEMCRFEEGMGGGVVGWRTVLDVLLEVVGLCLLECFGSAGIEHRAG